MSSDFCVIGRAVTHTARPRFRLVFSEAEGGGWQAGETEWLDGPPAVPDDQREARAMASYLARLCREAGDAFAAQVRRDWVQDRVIARAAELGLTSYAIAKAAGGAVSEDHIQAYLTRKKSMGSHKLQHVLRVLRLILKEE